MQRIVTIASGQIRGIAGNYPAYTVFKGIPFAKPPVGSLRWKAPEAPDTWDGVLDCFTFKTPCTQIPLPQGSLYQKEFFPEPEEFSEDCLYLSVWTPSMTFSPEDKLPVMVWYHGGAYVQGYDHEPEFDGEAFCRNGVILVTVPYRLGVFGYMGHPDLSCENGGTSGNYALLDQIFALRWVQENIAAFGGDPDNVTIFGQSAGGGSVQAICTSPLAGGLFHKAIIMSADPMHGMDTIMDLAQAEDFGKGLSDVLHTDIAGMRGIPADDLVQYAAAYAARRTAESGRRLRFEPIIDGYVLPENPCSVFRAGRNADVPYMAGSVSGDTSYCLTERCDSPAELCDRLKATFGSSVLTAIQADDTSSQVFQAAVRDAVARTRPEAFACKCEQLGSRPVWTYYFNVDIPGEDHPGAFHSSDLWYVFGTVARCHRPFTGADFDLSRMMNAYWCNFARTGDPNGSGLPFWPVHTANTPRHIVFNTEDVYVQDSDAVALLHDLAVAYLS